MIWFKYFFALGFMSTNSSFVNTENNLQFCGLLYLPFFNDCWSPFVGYPFFFAASSSGLLMPSGSSPSSGNLRPYTNPPQTQIQYGFGLDFYLILGSFPFPPIDKLRHFFGVLVLFIAHVMIWFTLKHKRYGGIGLGWNFLYTQLQKLFVKP